MPPRHPKTAAGYRSGLEEEVAGQLKAAGVPFQYEPKEGKLRYYSPEKGHLYTPDFVLDNGIRVETKGRFLPTDRAKHLLIKQQCPEIDIRFVFSRSSTPLRKGSKTTYADWCRKHGFQFADKSIPKEWLR